MKQKTDDDPKFKYEDIGRGGIRMRKKIKRSIKGTLMKAFMVPVLLIVILGTVSYITASDTIKSKVEESSKSNVLAMSMYCDLLLNNVSSKSLEKVTGSTMTSYYEAFFKQEGAEGTKLWNDAKTDLIQTCASVSYIYSYHIIPEKGEPITSSSQKIGKDAYQGFMESNEGKAIAEQKLKKGWFGYHSWIDEELSISADRYALTFIQRFSSANTYLVLDVKMETVDEILARIDLGNNAIKALIAPDGREIVRIQQEDGDIKFEGNDGQVVFSDKDFYTESRNAEEGCKYVENAGKKYLYVYAPVGNTGVMLCGLVPQENIVGEIQFIRNLSIFMVVFAAIIAFIIGSKIASGIGRTLFDVTKNLNEVAKGDFTQVFRVKRKDEFEILSKGLNDMLSGMQSIIENMRKFGNGVVKMADGVAGRSNVIKDAIKDISIAVDEVTDGMQDQVGVVETGNNKMADFAEKIRSVCNKAENMEGTIYETTEAAKQGDEIVNDLHGKSELTIEITKVLVGQINHVQQKSSEIENFVTIISRIAEQTNLLSLNASIEAARTGEKGRGFAVVAEEIRKLADESMQAGKHIKEVVANVVILTGQTASAAKEAENIIFSQTDLLEEAINIFSKINNCVEVLIDGIKNIAKSIQEVDRDKEQIQEVIDNVSSVTEQTAASMGEITATLDGQVKTVAALADEITLLKEDAVKLEHMIDKFKTSEKSH